MKMVTALGWETAGRFDYLVVELARFDGIAEPRAVQFDLYRDPRLMRLRLAAIQSNHFAPVCLERELFSPAPEGAYAGAGRRSAAAAQPGCPCGTTAPRAGSTPSPSAQSRPST